VFIIIQLVEDNLCVRVVWSSQWIALRGDTEDEKEPHDLAVMKMNEMKSPVGFIIIKPLSAQRCCPPLPTHMMNSFSFVH